MKIAQVICSYPPYRGGMGNVAYEYTERLRNRGHRDPAAVASLTPRRPRGPAAGCSLPAPSSFCYRCLPPRSRSCAPATARFHCLSGDAHWPGVVSLELLDPSAVHHPPPSVSYPLSPLLQVRVHRPTKKPMRPATGTAITETQ